MNLRPEQGELGRGRAWQSGWSHCEWGLRMLRLVAGLEDGALHVEMRNPRKVPEDLCQMLWVCRCLRP